MRPRSCWGPGHIHGDDRAAEAEPLLRRTLETATSLGNRRLAGYALLGLGGALVRSALGEACERLDDAAQAFREIGDQWGLALTLSTRGQLALLAGDHAAARSMHEEGLAAAQAIDNHYLPGADPGHART